MEHPQFKSVAYVPFVGTVSEFVAVLSAVRAAGIAPDRTTVGGSFVDWLDGLEPGVDAWVYSLALFGSVTRLVSVHEELSGRGVSLHSISEPWFNDPSLTGKELFSRLFELGEGMHRPTDQPRSTSRKSKTQPYAKGVEERVRRAIALRREKGISVVKACQSMGCSVTAYYHGLKSERTKQHNQ